MLVTTVEQLQGPLMNKDTVSMIKLHNYVTTVYIYILCRGNRLRERIPDNENSVMVGI